MNKTVRVMLIITGALAVLLAAGYWFMQWSVSFSGDIAWRSDRIPAPVKTIPPVSATAAGMTDWPSWLGPLRNNTSPVTGIKKDWSRGLKKAWEVGYLCTGAKAMSWACPAIRGNRLVVPGRDATNDYLFCLEPDTGALLWLQKYPLNAKDNYGQGQRATPAIDGDAVYTISREGDVRCNALFDGALRWEYNITNAGCTPPEWGSSGSPLVYKDMVIVHAGGKSIAIALDKMNGVLRWKAAPGSGCYSTPVVMTIGVKDYIVLYHKPAVSFIDAATGKTMWNIPTGRYASDMTAVTPAILGDTAVLVSTLKGGGSTCIRITNGRPEKLWATNSLMAYMTDPVLIDGYAYGYSGMPLANSMGSFVCVNLSNGAKMWSTNALGIGTTIAADGSHLICLNLSGTLYLVKADSGGPVIVTKFKGAIPEGKKRVWTKPVIANERIYLRHGNMLVCYFLK